MILNDYRLLLSTLNLMAALICVYYGRKLYKSTRGATEFWFFLSAFVASLGAYIVFDFARTTFLILFDSPIRAAQDIAITFAAIFALIAGGYAKKVFNELLED